jgi:catechol 2,3-dioxygenase-like lactoylglutathione lyase family enzyme
MIELKGIGHVNLRVADEEASGRFYRDQLGFVIAEENPPRPEGRGDQDEALRVRRPCDPPDWLLKDWPGPEMAARIESLRRARV